MFPLEDRCFACDKRLDKDSRMATTSDGQQVVVGINCYKKILNMNIHGYQPQKGGPRLYTTMLPYCKETCLCGAHARPEVK